MCQRSAGFALFLLMLASSAAPVSAQTLDDAFSALNTSLDAVPQREAARAPALRTSVDRLRGAAISLPMAERRDYAASLAAQADMLRAAAAEPDQARASRMISDVEADLALKAKADGLGATNALRGQVNVVARTMRGATEIKGLVIGANPIGLAGTTTLMFRFPRMSSPSARPLPPGRYEFVLLRDNEVISRERADVGTTSLDEVALDLSVPVEAPPR
jgi:hypothetical protein